VQFDQIITDLKNKVYHPIYFLMGEEPYFIDEISDYISYNVLDETEKEFNQTILYGRDTDVLSIISEAKRFPMMANHQVVIIKEAQYLKNIEELQPYFETPLSSTILVICYKYKSLDKRTIFAKVAAKQAVVFESKAMYEVKVQGWVIRHLKMAGYSINPKALVLITEYLGTGLGKIANELDKLMVNVEVGTEINAEHIEANIGISKEFNRFELQKAIGVKNILKANQIINYFAATPKNHPLVVTISSLFIYFSRILTYHYIKDRSRNNVASVLKVSPYFVGDYELAAGNYNVKKVESVISDIRESDLQSKGIGNTTTSEGDILKELVFRIMH